MGETYLQFYCGKLCFMIRGAMKYNFHCIALIRHPQIKNLNLAISIPMFFLNFKIENTFFANFVSDVKPQCEPILSDTTHFIQILIYFYKFMTLSNSVVTLYSYKT